MKKVTKYCFLLFFLFLIDNLVFADNNLKISIEKNNKKYDNFIFDEYRYLVKQADRDLFAPALKRCKDFAEKYFNERDNQVIIRNKIKKELLNNEKWEEYLLGVIHRLEIQSLVLSEQIVKDAGLDGNQMVEFYVNVDGKKIKKRLSLDKFAKDIYDSLERSGANEIPSNEAKRLFEKYTVKYKDTILTFKYFSQILATLSPILGINSSGTVVLGVSSVIADLLYNYIDNKVNDFKNHLRDAVIKAEGNFHEILEKLVTDELEKVIDYYKNVEFEKFVLP